jgi:hypothetical protein
MIENFSKSIFYPAGGTDLQILLRFSDISSTVISPTLSEYLTIENYERIFREKCAHINSYYDTNIIEYVGYEMLQTDLIKKNKFIPFPNGLFEDNEIRDYQKAFSYHYTKDNFVVKFLFDRTIGRSKRRLEWIALNTEGLATLISLTNLTNEHPKILCTIQSGILEYPNSLFTRLINYLELRSKIWVRGFWTKDDYLFPYNNDPISEFPPHQYKVQDYGYWYSNMGQNGLSNEENDTESKLSRVRAFTNELNFKTPRTTVISGNNNSKILLIQGDIKSADLSQYDLIVTSERILTNENFNNLQYWNTLSNRGKSTHYPIMTFAESLRIIQNQVEIRELKKIAITPVGFEDETMFLNEFIEIQKNEFELHIYFHRPLDFISLTAPNSV